MYSRSSNDIALGIGKASFSGRLSDLSLVETDPEGSVLSEPEVITEIFGAAGGAIFVGLISTSSTLAILFPFLGVHAGIDTIFGCCCAFEHSCTFVSIPVMGQWRIYTPGHPVRGPGLDPCTSI
jgi:hypothetical protein